jgi:hypothetical protein
MRHPTANASQRARRAKAKRIDYYPSPEALELIRERMGDRYPLNVWSGAIDAIVDEWAELAGINKRPEIAPMTSGPGPEFSDANARANDSGGMPAWLVAPENRAKQAVRVPCGARRRSDGQPCQALSVPGKRRCKWHGGCSTGPRTQAGRRRALQNLRRG